MSIASQLSFSKAQAIVGGATGSLPYQAATSSTAFITIGTNGFVLTSNGTTATWTAASGITSGNATNAANIATIAQIASGNYYPTFVDSNNAASANELVYTTGTIIVNPGTGSLAIGSTPVATARLTISQTYTIATAAESFPFYITGNYGIADTSLKQVIRSNYGGTHITGTQANGVNILALHSVSGVGGTTTNAYNYWSRMDNSTNATVTNAYNIWVENGAGSGGPVNLYGLYINPLTKGTTNYAVYTSGSTPSFFGGAVTVAGNLTVQGTTTIVDSTVTNVADPIITLGGGANNAAPTADDNKDRGIAFKWHNGTIAKNGFFGYDDSTGFLTFVPDATITNEVVSGTKGAADVNLAGGTAMSVVYQSAANTTAFLSAGTAGYILQTNGTGSAPTWVAASGLSAASANQVNTILTVTNATYYPAFVDSNNASATAESIYTTSSFSINPATGVLSLGGGASVTGTVTATAIVVTGSGGDITGANNITATGLITGGSFLATATTVSSSTSTGALQVRGGAGIAGNLYVGGTVFGTVNSATNLASGTAGQVPYQTGPGATSFYGPGTAGQLLVSNGAAAPVYTNTGSIFVGRATTANTLAAGSAMSVVYQSAANTTAFLAAGTAGQILQTNGTGSAPTWVAVSGLTAGVASQVNTVLTVTNATYYPTFVDTNNASATAESVYTTSSFSINPSTGNVSIRGYNVRTANTLNLTALNTGTFYPVTIPVDVTRSATRMRIQVGLNSGSNPGWGTHPNGFAVMCDWTVNGNGYGTIGVTRVINNYAESWTSQTIVGGITQMGQSSTEVIYLRGGGIYFFESDGSASTIATVQTGTYTTTGQTVTNTTTVVNSVWQAGEGAVGLNTLYLTGPLAVGTSPSVGTAGQILQSNGSAATSWVSPTGLTAGVASRVNTILTVTNATYYPAFVDSNNASATAESIYTTSSFSINPGTGKVIVTAPNIDGGLTLLSGAAGSQTSFGVGRTAREASFAIAANGSDYMTGTIAGDAILMNRSGNLFLGMDGAYTVRVLTSNTERMRIASSGNVGIRITNPEAYEALTIAGSIRTTSDNSAIIAGNDGNLGFIKKAGFSAQIATNNAIDIQFVKLNTGTAITSQLVTDTTTTELMRITTAGGISFGISGTAYGTAGQILQSNGNASPTWVPVSGTTVGTSTQAQTVLRTTNATHYATFVDSNNASATAESIYTTSSFTINPGTGVVAVVSNTAATSTSSGALQVIGGVGIGGNLYVGGDIVANKLTIQLTTVTTTLVVTDDIISTYNTTAASSTTTGALQVAGGAGIGGNIYAGGDIFSRGTKLVGLNIQEYTATASQTTFTVTNGYTVGTVQVFANGIQLGSGAIVASNGTTIVLNNARNAGDIIRVISGGSSTQANNIQSYSLAMSVALGA